MKAKVSVLIGLLIIALTAMVTPVMAANTGTAIITGNPPVKMDITINGGITNWGLDPSVAQPITDSTSVTMDVMTNSKSWVVSVQDALDGGKTSAGFMEEYTGAAYGTQTLTNALVVGAETPGPVPYFTGTEVTLSGAVQAFATSDGLAHAAGNHLNIPLTFKQTVDIADPVLTGSSVYRIITTFTATTP